MGRRAPFCGRLDTSYLHFACATSELAGKFFLYFRITWCPFPKALDAHRSLLIYLHCYMGACLAYVAFLRPRLPFFNWQVLGILECTSFAKYRFSNPLPWAIEIVMFVVPSTQDTCFQYFLKAFHTHIIMDCVMSITFFGRAAYEAPLWVPLVVFWS